MFDDHHRGEERERNGNGNGCKLEGAPFQLEVAIKMEALLHFRTPPSPTVIDDSS